MSRGPIYKPDYKPQFSGHETFPLRYGWLKKAYDAVAENSENRDSKAIFTAEDAIARFGIGKNMVSSMRHWSNCCNVIEDVPKSNRVMPTHMGKWLYDDNGGLDPYTEHPASLWLIHWHLAGRPDKTTWYWSFNNFPGVAFERDRLVRALEKLAADCGWPRTSATTIKRDVECFLRTYAARPQSAKLTPEDMLESPLTELGLIKATGRRDGFRFVRGPKSTLGHGVFLYALIRFWGSFATSSKTLSFEAIAHEPGSPGRVFLLEENDVADRLIALEDFSRGRFRWSETAGLKQVIRGGQLDSMTALKHIAKDFPSKKLWKAA